MRKCITCGKYYEEGMVRADFDVKLYCSYSCASVDIEREEREREQIEAQQRLARESQAQAQEAATSAARRTAWGPFEEKYASLFEEDIPDWFVGLFSLDENRGRYVAYDSDQIKALKETVESQGGKADGFYKSHYWHKKANHWFSWDEIVTERDKAKENLEAAIGIKFDPLVSGSDGSNWCWYDTEAYPVFYFKPPKMFQGILPGHGPDRSWWWNKPEDILPFKKVADALGKSYGEIDWSLYIKADNGELYAKSLILLCIDAKLDICRFRAVNFCLWNQEDEWEETGPTKLPMPTWDIIEYKQLVNKSSDEDFSENTYGWGCSKEYYCNAGISLKDDGCGWLEIYDAHEETHEIFIDIHSVTLEELDEILKAAAALGLGEEQTEEQCIAAVKQNPIVLPLVKNKTEAVYLASGIFNKDDEDDNDEEEDDNGPEQKSSVSRTSAKGSSDKKTLSAKKVFLIMGIIFAVGLIMTAVAPSEEKETKRLNKLATEIVTDIEKENWSSARIKASAMNWQYEPGSRKYRSQVQRWDQRRQELLDEIEAAQNKE